MPSRPSVVAARSARIARSARSARSAGRPLRRLAVLTTLLAAAVLGPAAAAQAVTVYAAASLRDAFPKIDGARDLQLRRLEPAPAPDRARRARRRLRVRVARTRPRRCSARAAAPGRSRSRRTGSCCSSHGRTPPTCGRSTACAGGACAWPSARRACRSATTRAGCCAGCACPPSLTRNRVSRETNVAGVVVEGRARLGRRRLRLRDRRPDRARARARDRAPALGPAARPLPGLRRAPPRRRRGRGQRLPAPPARDVGPPAS